MRIQESSESLVLALFLVLWRKHSHIHCKFAAFLNSTSGTDMSQRRSAPSIPDQHHERNGIPVQVDLGCLDDHSQARGFQRIVQGNCAQPPQGRTQHGEQLAQLRTDEGLPGLFKAGGSVKAFDHHNASITELGEPYLDPSLHHFCHNHLLLTRRPQWKTSRRHVATTEKLQLVERRVYRSNGYQH